MYIEALTAEDLLVITSTVYPSLPESLLQKMIDFTQKVSLYIVWFLHISVVGTL